MHVCERIKCSVLKVEYEEGGLEAPDIECLEWSYKLKQFLRASKSRHVIASFQTYSSENLGYKEVINQDYHKLSQDDLVLKIGQETITRTFSPCFPLFVCIPKTLWPSFALFFYINLACHCLFTFPKTY